MPPALTPPGPGPPSRGCPSSPAILCHAHVVAENLCKEGWRFPGGAESPDELFKRLHTVVRLLILTDKQDWEKVWISIALELMIRGADIAGRIAGGGNVPRRNNHI